MTASDVVAKQTGARTSGRERPQQLREEEASWRDCRQGSGEYGRLTVDPLLVTPAEAARLLGVSRSRIFTLMAEGRLRSLAIGRSRRLPLEGLRRFVEDQIA